MPVRLMALEAAVFVSLKTLSATVESAPRSMARGPWAINVPLDPLLTVATFTFRFHGLLVAATVALVVMLVSVTTVPLPQPLTVQSFVLNVRFGVWATAIVKTPEP